MSSKISFDAGIEQEGRAPVRHRPVAVVELITTVGLAFSTAVAATAISIGMARAGVAGGVADAESMAFTFASFIGLALFALGTLVTGLGGMVARHSRSD